MAAKPHVKMDRELLIEIGVEELPAAWMPELTRQLAERARRAPHRVPHRSGRADRELQHAPASDRPRRAHRGAPGRPRRNDHRSAGVGGVREGRPAVAGRARLCEEAGRGVRAADAREDAEGRIPGVPEARARAQRCRYAARHPHRPPARSAVPQADALGRAGSTTGAGSCCSAVRFAGCCFSTAAASCRSRSAGLRRGADPRSRTSSQAR